MADAEKKIITVTKPVTEERIALTLTTEEAEALRYLTRRISGDPKGPRGLFDNIESALGTLGVRDRVTTALKTHPTFPSNIDPWA